MTKVIDTERRLVAIFAADVEGYSRLMGADEVGTMQDLTQRRGVLDGLIAAHRGRIANTAGDSVLAEFGSVVDAVQCAVEAQAALAEANVDRSPDRHIKFRIGIHVGDVMVKGGDLFGDGVNIAARLQTLASAGGISISGVAHDQVRKILPFAFTDLGAQQVKNIEEPVRAFAVTAKGTVAVAASANISMPLALPDKPSIAVLPFQNMSGDPEQEYFADGMVEDIITALSRVKWFFVIARNSSFTYKGKPIDIKQVGRELGVRYVLEGSVRKAGNRVRITGQLIEAETGHHIWADRLEGDYDNIFELQDEVTSAVVSAVEPRLNLRERDRSNKKPTSDLTAYDCFLRAQPYFLRPLDLPSYKRAEELLREAIKIDPNYSSALAYLADCIARQCIAGMVPYNEGLLEAAKISEHAVEADPEDAAALAVAAWIFSVFIGRPALAREYAERALRLHPNAAFVCSNAGFALVFVGEFERGRNVLEKAFRISPLDPRNWYIFSGRGMAYFFEKNFEEALVLLERSIELSPVGVAAFRFKAAALIYLGRTAEARKVVDELRSRPAAPTFQQISDRLKWGHQWMRELYLDGLQRAGYE